MSELVTLLCTCPDVASGEKIAGTLVNERLAACVNLLPGVRSFYRWQGETNEDAEVLLLIKTDTERFETIEALIRKLHPYDLPELIALPIVTGSAAYLAWLREETARP